jgi:hypothetical protein
VSTTRAQRNCYRCLLQFLLGHAHANSAPPSFGLADLDLPAPEGDYTLNAADQQMRQARPDPDFWYQMGHLADQGHTLVVPEDEGGAPFLCFTYLEEQL